MIKQAMNLINRNNNKQKKQEMWHLLTMVVRQVIHMLTFVKYWCSAGLPFKKPK